MLLTLEIQSSLCESRIKRYFREAQLKDEDYTLFLMFKENGRKSYSIALRIGSAIASSTQVFPRDAMFLIRIDI